MINSMLKIKQKEYLAKRKVDVERIFQLRRYADAADLVAKMDKDQRDKGLSVPSCL